MNNISRALKIIYLFFKYDIDKSLMRSNKIGYKKYLFFLYSKLIFGGKSVLLMKPSLPVKWFDLSIIPEHDVEKINNSIFISKGPLVKFTHKYYKATSLIFGDQ